MTWRSGTAAVTNEVEAIPRAPCLHLTDAVQAALMHQPEALASRAQVAAAAARVHEARAALLPQLSGAASYTRTTANFVLRPGTLPSSVAGTIKNDLSNRSYNYFNYSLSASQLIYDFGQTFNQWDAAAKKSRAQNANDMAVRQIVVLNVRTAFFAARAQKELVQVARDTWGNQRKHREQTRGFVAVGTQPQIALAQAETDYANARVQLIEAENNYQSAKATLSQAMGLEAGIDYDVADDIIAEVAGEGTSTPALLQEALVARPEFVANAASVAAQQRILAGLRGTFGPSLGATAQATEAGASMAQLGWNWAVGVNLSWPLFSGGLNAAQIQENEALLTSLRAQDASTRLQVQLDIEQARLAVRAARAKQEASQDALTNAKLLLALAEGRFVTGVGGMIELGDAQVAATAAAAQLVQARFSLSQARATLLRALGREHF